MTLSREQFGTAVAEATHVKLETLIDALRAVGYAVEDVSYGNATDVSCAVYEGPEIGHSDEPIVSIFVVDPDSEMNDGEEPRGYYAPYVMGQWPAGHYVSEAQIANALGVEMQPEFDTLQEVVKWLAKVEVARVMRVAEEIAQEEV